MKRPIVIACIGYLIGIIWGLYLEIGIVLFILFVSVVSLKILSKSARRYLKLYLKKSVILLFSIMILIGYYSILISNKQYERFYQEKEISIIAQIISDVEQKEYSDNYKIKVIQKGKYKNIQLYLQVKKGRQYQYGDIIQVEGTYIEPTTQRNDGGFNYKQYLKTQKIYGTIVTTQGGIKLIQQQRKNMDVVLHEIRQSIIRQIEDIFPAQTGQLLIALLVGETGKLNETIKEEFRIASLSHVLVVSGMHVSYIMLRN